MKEVQKARLEAAADVIRDVNAATAEDERRREHRRIMTRSTPERDLQQIERMADWRYPRGSLSREIIALRKRVEELEGEVQRLKSGTLPDLR